MNYDYPFNSYNFTFRRMKKICIKCGRTYNTLKIKQRYCSRICCGKAQRTRARWFDKGIKSLIKL